MNSLPHPTIITAIVTLTPYLTIKNGQIFKYYEFIMILVEEKYDINVGELNQVFCERQEC